MGFFSPPPPLDPRMDVTPPVLNIEDNSKSFKICQVSVYKLYSHRLIITTYFQKQIFTLICYFSATQMQLYTLYIR